MGKGNVSARRGWAGEKKVIFSILLEGVCRSFNEMTLLSRAEANLEDHPAAFFTVHGGNGGIDQVLFAASGR